MDRLRRSLSFANVVAVLALFFALGGTVYAAGKISGSQIKPGSMPGNRIKNKSLTAKQIKPGSLTGAQINGSTLTGVSASSLGTVQYVSTVVPLVSEASAGTSGTAGCPVGQKVIGGGATVNNPNFAYVNESAPSADRNGWFADGYSGIPGVSMTITAICTPVTTATG